MEMKFLAIVFVVVSTIRAQCRSVTLPNATADAGEKNSVDTQEELRDKPITPYERNFTNLKKFAVKISHDTDTNNQREMQFLSQLELLVKRLAKESRSKAKDKYAKVDNVTNPILQASTDKPMMKRVNDLKDLLDTLKELDIIQQNGEISDEHIRIKRTGAGYKGTAFFATSDREERMISMLIDIQRQLVQIRKYLDKLCKKHNSTITTTPEMNSYEDDSLPRANQPNKPAII